MAGLLVVMGAPVFAQFTYPGCAPLDATQFKATEIFNRHGTYGAAASDESMDEPVQFALHGVKKAGVLDHVDIYFVERGGGTGTGINAVKGDAHVKYYDAAAKKIVVLGTIKVKGDQDSGLMGIAVDPDFDNNHWLYLWYVPPVANANDNRRLKLVRYTVKSDNTLDMTTPKTILDILGSRMDHWHSGGPMEFDSYGDLWIQIGNNSDDVDTTFSQFSKDSLSNDEWGAGNTASLRGGTIRIHPDNSAKGYSIPKGNFGEYWANEWDKQGRTKLAAQYRDTSKVAPEVYIKGERSNYSIWVHPTKRIMAWGTVNYGGSLDEFNITDHPIFSGFPYFMADNVPTIGEKEMLGFVENPAVPLNLSKLKTGVDTLPPAVPGVLNVNLTLAGKQTPFNVAIGGPLYVYDRNNLSKTKFPPHLNNVWIGFTFTASKMYLFTVDSTTLKVTAQADALSGIFSSFSERNSVGAHYGPDGALYVLNYDGPRYGMPINPGVTRIDYTGACQLTPDAVAPEAKHTPDLDVFLSVNRIIVNEPGEHEFTLLDLRGNRLVTYTGKQGAQYPLQKLRDDFHLQRGVHVVRVKTAKGVFTQNVSFL